MNMGDLSGVANTTAWATPGQSFPVFVHSYIFHPAMTADELFQPFPRLTVVLETSWIRRIWSQESERLIWYQPWLSQIESDLAIIEKHHSLSKLIKHYRPGLRDLKQLLQTAYEVHGAALFAAIATHIELHVRRDNQSNRNFDIQAEVEGTIINADVKTRDDDFLSPRFQVIDDSEGLREFVRERPLIDPNEAAVLGMSMTPRPAGRHLDAIPEATKIKDRLREASAQLPTTGVNIVLLGHVSGNRKDLERALEGTETHAFVQNRRTGETWLDKNPFPTGAFDPGQLGELYGGISGVLWMRLVKLDDDKLYRAYRLYVNELATSGIPELSRAAIEKVAASLTFLPDVSGGSFEEE